MHEELAKEKQDKIKLKKNNRRKIKFGEKTETMMDILTRNNAVLMGEDFQNLAPEEYHRLKKENILTIQNKFYELMEKNPLIFKIPHLLHQRKKHLKEVTFIQNSGGQVEEEKMTFTKVTNKKERLINAQIVTIS